MSRRSRMWRVMGAVLMIGGCIGARRADAADPVVLVCCAAAIVGVVLAINGRRAITAIRAERRGHALTFLAIRRGQAARRR